MKRSGDGLSRAGIGSMSDLETCLFSGRVKKRRLPVFPGPPPPDAPLLKRLILPQGQLAQFWDGSEPIHYLAYLELLSDSVRGNHYHLLKRELIYVVSGELSVSLQDTQSRVREKLALGAGELGMIAPGIAHAYLTMAPGHAVEFSSAPFNAKDLYPWTFD